MKIKIRKISIYIITIILVIPLFFIQSTTLFSHIYHDRKDSIKYETSEWVDSVMKTLTEDEKIGQLFMVAAYPQQGKPNKDNVSKLINDYHVGGLIFFKSGPVLQAKLTNYYQRLSNIPLMIAGDYEWGL